MSYVIDVYRGEARPMRRFTDYMCFEAFFPDLVAGPIIRYAAMEEQMRVRQHTADKFARGVAFFALGMAKKILIANPMGHIADSAFAAGSLHPLRRLVRRARLRLPDLLRLLRLLATWRWGWR